MLKFGLIGCGRIGSMHADILHHENDVMLDSVFDLNTNLAKEVSKKTGAKICNHDFELFDNNNLDAVLIASATSSHADYIEKALKNGKPVFCEKPIDLSLDRIRKCFERIKNINLPIQIGFNRRFDPSHAAIKKLLKENKIGQLNQVIITSRDPEMPSEDYYKSAGGLFKDMTIHDFDLARFYLDEDPVEIFATGQRLIDPKMMNKINDYDTAMFILTCMDGKQCFINNSRTAVYGYDQRVELLGSNGMLQSGNHNLDQTKIYKKEFSETSSPYLYFFIERYKEAFSLQLKSFIKSIKQNSTTDVGFEDGFKALAIADAAYKSLKEKKSISINYNW